jgi:polyphosphate kinase
LEDADITKALYRAAQAGVKVDLIVRDTCRLRPGLPGLSENVRVISILGRFLEHGRIFYFRNGGQEEYFISSADCMKRNLESRVEVVVPIEDPLLRKELRAVLDTQLSGNHGEWEMQADGHYVRHAPEGGYKSCQQMLIELAEKRQREAGRLKKRRPKGVARRTRQ